MPRNRLYKWRDAIATDGEQAFRGSGRRSPQQQELAQLRRQVARLEQENAILKRSDGVLRERIQARYAWIDGQRMIFPLADLCRALTVSLNGYHAWKRRPPSTSPSNLKKRR